MQSRALCCRASSAVCSRSMSSSCLCIIMAWQAAASTSWLRRTSMSACIRSTANCFCMQPCTCRQACPLSHSPCTGRTFRKDMPVCHSMVLLF